MTQQISKFGKDSRVNPGVPDDHLEAKWPEPALGSDLLTDQEKYYSKQCLQREQELLWPRTWQMAGRVSDLASVGSFLRYDIGIESFIVVRTRQDRIQAFYNVCPHRGSQIVLKDFGISVSFVCPYHSWTWALNGRHKHVTDSETFAENLICDKLDLVEVRCEQWGGFVFINMDADADPLIDFLDVLPEHLKAFRFEDMVVVADICTEWDANWKIALDAFMEGYHVHRRHPEVSEYMDEYHTQRDMFANGHGRLLFPMAVKSPRLPNQSKLSDGLRELIEDYGLDPQPFEDRAGDVRVALQKRKREWAEGLGLDFDRFTDSQLTDDWNYNIFPNVTFNIHCDSALLMRFRPHPTDPHKCFYDTIVLAMPVDDPEYRLPRYMGLPPDLDLSKDILRPDRIYLRGCDASLGEVLDQDAEIVPFVQKGVQSRVFKGVRLSEQEIRLRHFYAEYDRFLEGNT